MFKCKSYDNTCYVAFGGLNEAAGCRNGAWSHPGLFIWFVYFRLTYWFSSLGMGVFGSRCLNYRPQCTQAHTGQKSCLHQLCLVCATNIDLQASYELAVKPPLDFYGNMINIINLCTPFKRWQMVHSPLISWDSMVQYTSCTGTYGTLAFCVSSCCCCPLWCTC